MTAAWPSNLPAYVLEQGFNENLAAQVIETPMEAGSPKWRRRFTRNNRLFAVDIAMDETQSEAFETFFDTTLLGGSQPFTWVHPRRQTAMTFQFKTPPPKITQITGAKRVWTMTLEALTDPI